LLIALISPAVLEQLLNDAINSEAVMSMSNPNLGAWETNVPPARRRLEELEERVEVDGDILGALDDAATVHSNINYDLHYFHIENPDEVMNGEKPRVTELGPYSYDEWYNKFDVSFSENGEEVTYNQQKYYTYNSEASNPALTEEDEIRLIYPTVVGFEYLLGQVSRSLSF